MESLLRVTADSSQPEHGDDEVHNAMSNTQERFYKLGDVQTMFDVSRSTVWRWHAERGLKVVTIGGVTRIRESDLQAFLARYESKPLDGVEAKGGNGVKLTSP